MSMKRAQRFGRYLAMMVGCLCVLGLDNGPGRPPRPPGLDRAANAEDEAKVKRLNKQLDEILEVQATILQRYDELMAELAIVKVRASQ